MRKALAIAFICVGLASAAQYTGGIGGGGGVNCMPAINWLPVELLHFSAAAEGMQVLLEWTTATELNNAGFHIERSSDGERYEAIAEVAGMGTTPIVTHYEALDREPLSGLSYYRLRQTDFDGTATYSDVVSVTIAKSELVAYPNPTDNQVWLAGMITGEEVTVLDAMGRTLRRVSATDGPLSVDLSAMPSGRYVIRVAGPGSLRTLPVVKR
ncbi:MAG: T9SS type A sorting domain-containing protein [Flavobacteriales bacterium]|nr:T9SS type A sorting domain-containing protein [Flavobacteriales bacterium]